MHELDDSPHPNTIRNELYPLDVDTMQETRVNLSLDSRLFTECNIKPLLSNMKNRFAHEASLLRKSRFAVVYEVNY